MSVDTVPYCSSRWAGRKHNENRRKRDSRKSNNLVRFLFCLVVRMKVIERKILYGGKLYCFYNVYIQKWGLHLLYALFTRWMNTFFTYFQGGQEEFVVSMLNESSTISIFSDFNAWTLYLDHSLFSRYSRSCRFMPNFISLLLNFQRLHPLGQIYAANEKNQTQAKSWFYHLIWINKSSQEFKYRPIFLAKDDYVSISMTDTLST